LPKKSIRREYKLLTAGSAGALARTARAAHSTAKIFAGKKVRAGALMAGEGARAPSIRGLISNRIDFFWAKPLGKVGWTVRKKNRNRSA